MSESKVSIPKGQEVNDYKNPVIWIITLISLLVAGVVYLIVFTITDPGFLGAGVIPATGVFVSWVIMWEAYKRTKSFKTRYGYQ
jgi:hypothetical protein